MVHGGLNTWVLYVKHCERQAEMSLNPTVVVMKERETPATPAPRIQDLPYGQAFVPEGHASTAVMIKVQAPEGKGPVRWILPGDVCYAVSTVAWQLLSFAPTTQCNPCDAALLVYPLQGYEAV